MSNLEYLLSRAANIGADTRTRIDAAKADADKAKARAANAKEASDGLAFEGSGFASPRYTGMVEVAGVWGSHFNAESQDSRDARDAMASAFIASMTGQTDKSAAGGKKAGYAAVIGLGNNAEAVRAALQSRLNHWKHVHDSAPEGESAKDAAERKSKARRFLTPCGPAPDVEGGAVMTNPRNNETAVPKFCGRPSGVFGGVALAYGRGTDRDAQMAAFARLYAEHGDKVLSPVVIDAFLDNGGRFKADSEATIESVSGSVLASLDELMAMGGKSSGDAAMLMAAHAVIDRIRTQGFKSSSVAAAQPEARTDAEIEANVPEVVAPVGDVQDVLEGVGVALGAPEPEAAGEAPKVSRPRRNRGKEVQAGV